MDTARILLEYRGGKNPDPQLPSRLPICELGSLRDRAGRWFVSVIELIDQEEPTDEAASGDAGKSPGSQAATSRPGDADRQKTRRHQWRARHRREQGNSGVFSLEKGTAPVLAFLSVDDLGRVLRGP